jgi:hypothetical protein
MRNLPRNARSRNLSFQTMVEVLTCSAVNKPFWKHILAVLVVSGLGTGKKGPSIHTEMVPHNRPKSITVNVAFSFLRGLV